MVSITLVVGALYFVLQSPTVQTWLTTRIAQKLSEELHCEISVSRVDFSFFNKLVLDGVSIRDQKGQPLLKINELQAGIMYFKNDFSSIRLSSLNIDSLDLNLYQDTLESNYRFLFDYFKKDSTSAFKLDCSYIIVQHSGLHYKKHNAEEKAFGINYRDLDFKDINIRIDRFNILNDSISINIESLALTEQSGLRVRQLNTLLSITPRRMLFTDLRLETSDSWFDADTLYFNYNSIADLSDFNQKVNFRFKINKSNIALSEIAYFSPTLKGMNDHFELSGILSGEIPSLSGENVIIQHKSNLYFHSDFNIIGLPDVENSFYYADIYAFDGVPGKLSKIRLPDIVANKSISGSEILDNLGRVHYTGNFTGFYNDFVAFGSLITPLGKITSDIRLEQINDSLGFSGKIKGKNFEIGKLSGIDQAIGATNLSLRLNGGYSTEYGIAAYMEGNVDNGIINGYAYENMRIEGNLINKLFDGKINLDDPNLAFDFAGIFDFSKQVPFFEFSAIVDKVRLDKLNLFNGDSLPEMAMVIKTNFSGENADNLVGDIFVWDVSYKSLNHNVKLDKLLIQTNKTDSSSIFNIESSAIDLTLTGDYSFSAMSANILSTLSKYFPQLILPARNPSKASNNFNFTCEVKDVNSITEIILPELKIPPGTKINGNYNASNAEFNTRVQSGSTFYKGLLLNGLSLNLEAGNDTILSELFADTLFFRDQKLVNVELMNTAFRDTVLTKLNFSNKEKPRISGNIISTNHFYRDDKGIIQNSIFLKPSRVTIIDSTWYISESEIKLAKNILYFDSLFVHRNDQNLLVYGELNNENNNSLVIKVKQFPISNLNALINRNDVVLNGQCTGKIQIIGKIDNPLFTSMLKIDELGLNHKDLGSASLNTDWDWGKKQLNLSCDIRNDSSKILTFSGFYSPSDEFLNLGCRFNKFNLSNLEPFAEGLVSEVYGILSDSINILGKTDQLKLKGRLKVQKASALVDYLNTRYQFSDFILFEENKIKFDSIHVFDVNGNEAICTGNVSHNYFNDFVLDISMDAKQFFFLNTTPKDNSLYYGKAFGSGSISFTGPLNQILLSVNLKTYDNTRIYIPLSDDSEAETNSVVTFVKAQGTDSSTTKTIRFNPDANQGNDGVIALDMDLEITPEAEVQLIFDSKIGDIMQGYGNGNLKLEYTREGDFNMYGDYTLSSGKYLFTLANFMSKKFSLRDGGTIRWYGDPYDAYLDVSAYYRVNSRLADLLQDTTDYYMNRIPIDCQIDIKGSLLKPEYGFSILLPGSAETEQALLDNMPENEMNKQFISLLLINNFQPLNGLSLNKTSSNYSGYNLTQSTSEILSNQLSHWVSQISKDFDVGFSYQPGDQVSTQQLELALRTQLFNDRLTVNGNVGMGGEYENTNSILGDMEAELKLNKSGKIRLKAFSKSNTRLDYEKGLYTRGLGIFYREDFDSIEELWRRYISIFMKNEKP